MSLKDLFKIKRCWRCLNEIESIEKDKKRINAIDQKLEELSRRQSEIFELQCRIDNEKMILEDRERMFVQREGLIEDAKKFFAEKELLLKKREDALWSEKEKMVGTDNLEIKRTILLPSLQQKWDAEKKKIDAERVKILQETPKVWESLESTKAELEKIIATIKSKPSSTSNQNLLIENEGRLKQLLSIIALIDKEKGEVHA